MANNKTVSVIATEAHQKSIYMIRQEEKNNEALVIHPFYKSGDFLNLLKHKRVKIVVDKEVEQDFIKKIKSMMYDFIENDLTASNDSDVFWYRVAGSLVFGIFIFFFANFLIPDPIPYIDEFAFSCLGGIIFYMLCVKLKLFVFISSKRIEEYSKYFDNVQIHDSKALVKLNSIFHKHYKKLHNNGGVEKFENIFKKEINSFSTIELLEIKDVISILAQNYSFKKIAFNEKQYLEELKESPLSAERFNFYYLFNQICFD